MRLYVYRAKQLPKLYVVGSIPIARSNSSPFYHDRAR